MTDFIRRKYLEAITYGRLYTPRQSPATYQQHNMLFRRLKSSWDKKKSTVHVAAVLYDVTHLSHAHACSPAPCLWADPDPDPRDPWQLQTGSHKPRIWTAGWVSGEWLPSPYRCCWQNSASHQCDANWQKVYWNTIYVVTTRTVRCSTDNCWANTPHSKNLAYHLLESTLACWQRTCCRCYQSWCR